MPSPIISRDLKKRIITGLVGVLILLPLVIYGASWGIILVAWVVASGMVFEFSGMTLSLKDKREKQFILLSLVAMAAVLNFYQQLLVAVVVSFLALFAYFLISARRHRGQAFETHAHELMYSFFGLVYLGFLPLFLPALRRLPDGLHWGIAPIDDFNLSQ